MKVVMVSKALVTEAYRRKAEEIAALGAELTVVVPPSWRDSRGRQQVNERKGLGYNMLVAPILLNGHFHLHFYPTLARILAQVQPQILHMDEEPYNFATWLALRMASRQAIPALFFSWQNIQRHYPPPFRWMERDVYRRAAHAIAGNSTAADVLKRKGYAGPLTVIPQFGADPLLFKPRAEGSHAQTEAAQRVHIGYAGGLVPEKGVDLLLQACSTLQGNWHLHIVGSGHQEPTLRRLAATLQIDDKVEFGARLSSVEMPAFYQKMDLFVLPSRTTASWKEQFGRVLIEAMASSVAVIGSSSGEIPSVIGDAGCIVPEGDAAALSACMQQLIDAPSERQRLGQRGRQRVLQNFTMQHVARETVEIYQRIVDSTA